MNCFKLVSILAFFQKWNPTMNVFFQLGSWSAVHHWDYSCSAAASVLRQVCEIWSVGTRLVEIVMWGEKQKNSPIQTPAQRHMNRSLVSGLETSSANLASSHSLLMTGGLLFIVIHRRGQVIKLGATGLFGSQDKITDSLWKRTWV